MRYIDKILSESVATSDIDLGRPNLLALTRATTKLIYEDLVAVQPSSTPVAALYGVKYLNPNKELSFLTGATYSGKISDVDRDSITELSMANLSSITKGQYFKSLDVVFKALTDTPFAGTAETEVADVISEAIAASTIRLVPDAAETAKFEDRDVEISEAGFIVNKWQAVVHSRKFKTEITVELAQDMEANGFDTPEFLEDLLATQMAEEINKDVMQSLITVSSRYKVKGVSDKGVLDLTTIGTAQDQGRELYRMVCEMNASIQRASSYTATYVVGASRVVAVLAASGWLSKKKDTPDNAYGTLLNGLHVYCDNTSPVDYLVVGVKAEYGEQEMIGSLFYAPYTEGRKEGSDPVDHMGAYTVITDPSSLQPRVALLMRYALCVNPYTVGINEEEARIIDATDMDKFAGQSKMSMLLGVKLPKIEK